jgi:hypothetical protein
MASFCISEVDKQINTFEERKKLKALQSNIKRRLSKTIRRPTLLENTNQSKLFIYF